MQGAVRAGFNRVTCVAVIEDRFDTGIEASAFGERICVLRSKRPSIGIVSRLILHIRSRNHPFAAPNRCGGSQLSHPELVLNSFVASEFLCELEDRFCYAEVITHCKVQILVMRRIFCWNLCSVYDCTHRDVAVQIAAHDGEVAVVILGSVVVNIAELVGVLRSGSVLVFAERNIEEVSQTERCRKNILDGVISTNQAAIPAGYSCWSREEIRGVRRT